jgi:hypothetical protein
MLQTRDLASLTKVMGDMYQGMLKGAAANEAAAAQLRRGIGGKF